jgi:hypothetical protein
MAKLYELTRPLAFLTAKGPTLKLYRDWLPVGFAALCLTAYLLLPVPIKLIGADSASGVMAPLFAGLPGFFIAALAAVSTFQGGDLDREMESTTIWILANGDGGDTDVTLRVFLSHLFAYLTLLSGLGFLLCAGATLLAGNIAHFQSVASASATGFDDAMIHGVKSFFVFALAGVTGSVLSCTALGLYFLAERVHQEFS